MFWAGPKYNTRSCHLELGWALSLKDLCRLTRVHSYNVSSTLTDLTLASKVLTKMGQILLSLQDWYVVLCDRCNDWEPFHSCVLMRTVISKLKMSRGEYYTSHLSLWFIGHNVRYTDMFKLFCT